jgi:plastocyanin
MFARITAFAIVFSTLIFAVDGFHNSANAQATSESSTASDQSSLARTEDKTEGKTESKIDARTFRFTYGAALTEISPGTKVRVWIPMAVSNHDQEVSLESTTLPATFQETTESKFGNKVIYFEATADQNGEVPMEVVYRVTRREVSKANYEPATGDFEKWLEASSLVPNSERLRKVVLGDSSTDGETIDVARRIYDGVGDHMKYDKPADQPGWGNGDAVWACDRRFGNCTDFHSLFMSSARSLKIPSRFEIGFPIPETIGSGDVGGYHCWAKFLSDEKWVPVDISEADKNPEMKDYYFGNLTKDRVTFSVGRDLELQPAPAAGPINYLAYPYAEIDGKPHKKFRKAFKYEDIASGLEATN